MEIQVEQETIAWIRSFPARTGRKCQDLGALALGFPSCCEQMRTKLSGDELGRNETPNTIPGLTEGLWGWVVPPGGDTSMGRAQSPDVREVQLCLFLLGGNFWGPSGAFIPPLMILHLITAH